MEVNLAHDLDAKIRASFFILMQACTELKTYDIPHFEAIKKEVLAASADLTRPADLTPHKQAIIDALRRLYSLKVYFNLAEEWTGYKTLYQKAAESDMKPMQAEMLFKEHLQILVDNAPDQTLDINSLSDWVSCIPLRMASARYYDYVTDAFETMLSGVDETSAPDFQRLFNPRDYIDEATPWLNEPKIALDEIWACEQAIEWDAAQITAFNQKLSEINQKLIECAAYLNALFDALCALSIVYKAASRNISLPDTPEAKQVYEAYKAVMQKWQADGDSPDDDFPLILDQAAFAAMEKVRLDASAKIEAAALSPDNQAVYDEWRLVHTAYFETGFDYFNFSSRLASEDKREGNVPAFMAALQAYIETCVQALPNKRKRFLKQHFLKYLPYPYELEDYKNYFLESYDGLDDINRRLLSFMVLSGKREG